METLKVEWTDLRRDRVVPAKVYFPKPGEGPFPIVIFSHGLGGSRDGYGYLGRHLAKNGYVSVHLQHRGSDAAVWEEHPISERVDRLRDAAFVPKNAIDRPQDVSLAIDELTALNDAKSHLRERLDLNRIGVAGHSFGAFTALATVGEVLVMPNGEEISFRDPRVKAAVAMSTSVPKGEEKLKKTFGGIKTPCLHMTGTLDESPFGDTKPCQRRAPFDCVRSRDQFLVTFTGGDHFIFSGRWREQPGGKDDKMFQELICLGTTAFFDAYVKEDRAAMKWWNEDFATILGDRGVFEKK